MSFREKYHAKLRIILRDFGYRFAGDTLIALRVAYVPERVVQSKFASIAQAAEWLIPIIADDDYYRRLKAAAQ